MLKTFLKTCSLMDRRAYWSMAAVALLILLNTALEVVGIGLLPAFLGIVADPDRILTIEPVRRLYDAGGFSDPISFLGFCGLGFVVLIAIKNAAFLYLTYFSARFVTGQAAAISRRLLATYLGAPYVDYVRWPSADLITTTDVVVDQMAVRVISGGISAATEMFVLFGIGTMLLVVEPTVTLMVAGLLGGLFLLLFTILQRRMTGLGAQDIELRRGRLQCIQHALGSIKDIRILGRERYFLDLFQQLRSAHARIVALSTTLQQVPRAVIETLVIAGIMTIVLVLLWQGRDTASIVGVLGLFGVAAFRVIPSLTRLMMALNNLRYGQPAVERVSADFAKAAPRPESPLEGSPLPPLRDGMELDHVTFAYPGSRERALDDVTLWIARGESIGVVGPSGAGKSTLVDLILGLLSPDSGKILVDGDDIARNLHGWQRHLGHVPQVINLIDDTIRRNVAFGLPDSMIDDASVWRALCLARLDLFVTALPDGLDTSVGDHGALLSGGQRQRLGIARALYNDPDVVIMDEATSALDGETENEITRALDTLRGRKTLIVIAHRLTTLRGCDKLVLIEAGRISDVGSFTELAARSLDFRKALQYADITHPPERMPVLEGPLSDRGGA